MIMLLDTSGHCGQEDMMTPDQLDLGPTLSLGAGESQHSQTTGSGRMPDTQNQCISTTAPDISEDLTVFMTLCKSFILSEPEFFHL